MEEKPAPHMSRDDTKSRRPATAAATTADWVTLCRGNDIPRGARQRYTFEGRSLLISRTRTGRVTVEDVAEQDLHNYTAHTPSANRSGEPLKSWPAREAEGYIKIFLGRGKDGHEVRDGDGHDLSPREIERFLNVELSSGVSRFNIPEEVQAHLGASVHLHARAKRQHSQDTMELESAAIDSSASRTNVETILMPSAPSYIQFLAGPGAAPHWKSGRAVTPDLDKADAARMHHGTAIGPSSVCEEHKVRAPEGKVRKPLRPISAAVNSPARRAESKKTAWQKHVKRLRPVTALKKFDHLQEYRDRMPTKVTSLKTDPESLAELRDSVTNFQAKFRQSILSGLIAQYKKKDSKFEETIGKMKKEQEVMKVDAQELEKKAAAFAIRLEEFDSEIEGLQEQARPLEDKVDAVQKMIQDRGRQGRSERLEKELKEERSKMNTIKGKIREVQASRQKINLHHQTTAGKLREKDLALRKLEMKLGQKIGDRARVSDVVAQVETFLSEGETIEVDERFPPDLAAAVRAIQENVHVEEEKLEAQAGGARYLTDELANEGDNADREPTEDGAGHGVSEIDWRGDPSVWIRRRELAMRATSPRWRNNIVQETHKWEQKYKRPEERKRELDEDPDIMASPNKRIKSPCTKTFKETHSIAALNFEKSFFAKMKENCLEDWHQDFSNRLLQKNGRDHRSNWFYQGLPIDNAADVVRLKEIRKDAQHPSPQEDLARFRKAMAGKWKNMDKIFRDIDKSGDGMIDVHEFSNCCKRLKLGWSEFQVHRVFRNAAGDDMQLDFLEFYAAFAPPRATSEIKMLFHNKVPFLILEPEAAVEEVVSAFVKVLPAKKAGEFVYKVACDVQDHMYFILEGQVRLIEANGKEIKVVGPGDCFGEMAVLHSDLGKHGLLRRDSAQALTTCTLYTLSRSDLEHIFPRYPTMRQKLYKLSPMLDCDARAAARGLCPKYPDCHLGGSAYTSFTGKVAVEPKLMVPPRLRQNEHLRTSVHDKHMGWPALQLESSVNEHLPDASGKWPEEGSVERTLRLKPTYQDGLEMKKTFDDEPTPAERIDKIKTTFTSKYFRLKTLRREGESYLANIGGVR